MKPRKLTAIVIDDEEPLSAADYGRCLDMISVSSETELQQLVCDVRQGKRTIVPDVFAVDVNFIRMGVPSGLIWGTADDSRPLGMADVVRPLGPLMVLPFLTAGECTAFVPYSQYWQDPGVTRNGYVLLAVSVLLSAVTGNLYSLDTARQYLETEFKRGSLANAAGVAIFEGVKRFRKRLKELAKSEGISVLNLATTLGRLENVYDTHEHSQEKIPCPLADDEGPLYVELCWGSMKPDRIELSSLFADYFLEPKRSHSSESNLQHQLTGLRKITQELHGWSSVAIEVESLFTVAVECLNAVGKECRGMHYAKDVIERRRQGLDRWQLRRLVVEFAWVRAWLEEPDDPKKRLNLVREYLGLCSWCGRQRGMQMDPSASRKYVYLVAGDYETVTTKSRWRKPFNKQKGVNDAYQLNDDKPACLTAVERALCCRYAIEEFEWDNSLPRYPAWMTGSEECT